MQPKDTQNAADHADRGVRLVRYLRTARLQPAHHRVPARRRQRAHRATCAAAANSASRGACGGKDANKPNTWRDLIACAEDLIARGVTTKDKLFIFGGSAGGIAMGMALTERPDLFAGVIDAVPAANTTRDEFSANGPPNIPEFGTIATQAGIHAICYAMDSYQHVKDGATYPAVLITTGLNDPRVSPWEPAKFAARLQASGTPNPVLLRIETDGGHGVGSTANASRRACRRHVSFMFWRAGVPGWRPDGNASQR